MSDQKTTQELINELTEKLIIPLEDNEIICPTCKGLRLIYKQVNDTEAYIHNCTHCHNGKLYVCKHCGKANITDYCNCDKASKEREDTWQKEEDIRNQKRFEKAKKIKFKDYNGCFILESENFIKDSDDIYDWLYEKIKDEKLLDDEIPKYLWATIPSPVFDLDLIDIIHDRCEDGYEDMDSYLNLDDEDLAKAQEHLDKWYKKQGNSINIYNEDYSTAVLLDDLIQEIKENIKKAGE